MNTRHGRSKGRRDARGRMKEARHGTRHFTTWTRVWRCPPRIVSKRELPPEV